MKLMFWNNQEAESNEVNELDDEVNELDDEVPTKMKELELWVICIVLSITMLFRVFKNNEKNEHIEKEQEQEEWNKSEDKKKAKISAAMLVASSILPFLIMESLEDQSFFFKCLDSFTKFLVSFTGENAIGQAETIVGLMKDWENLFSLDQLAVLIVYAWLFSLTKQGENGQSFVIVVPLLVLTIELVKAAANDEVDLGFVDDESEGTNDLVETLTFLAFIFFWAFGNVNDFVKSKKFETHCVACMRVLFIGFILELFDVSFKDRFLPNDLHPIMEWFLSLFVFFHFWLNRMLLWPAYLLKYVFHPLSDKLKSFQILGPCMSYLTLPVWFICNTYFTLPFLWYPWCPFTIIVEMNKAKDNFIKEQKELEWYRKWRDEIFEVIEQQLKQNVTKIYLIKIESKIENHRTNVEWPRLTKDLKEKESWDSKILETHVSYEEFTSYLDCLNENKFMIIASCPHIRVEKVKEIQKKHKDSVKLLEHDCE